MPTHVAQALGVRSNVQLTLNICNMKWNETSAKTSHAAQDLLQSLDVGIITQACEPISKTEVFKVYLDF